MISSGTPSRRCLIDRFDPRTRLLAACSLALALALSQSPAVLAGGAALGAALAVWAWADRRPLLRRWLLVNTFLVLMSLPLTFSTPGAMALQAGPLTITVPGLVRSITIVLRGNSIFLCCAALLGTLGAMDIARALQQLGMPSKLTQLFFLTIRYSDTLTMEYRTLRLALRARGFRPSLNAHSLRTFGYLVGNLLARSFDRSQRVLDAMKCRGFQGTFHVLQPARFRTGDRLALATAVLLVMVITWVQLG